MSSQKTGEPKFTKLYKNPLFYPALGLLTTATIIGSTILSNVLSVGATASLQAPTQSTTERVLKSRDLAQVDAKQLADEIRLCTQNSKVVFKKMFPSLSGIQGSLDIKYLKKTGNCDVLFATVQKPDLESDTVKSWQKANTGLSLTQKFNVKNKKWITGLQFNAGTQFQTPQIISQNNINTPIFQAVSDESLDEIKCITEVANAVAPVEKKGGLNKTISFVNGVCTVTFEGERTGEATLILKKLGWTGNNPLTKTFSAVAYPIA